MMFLLDLAFAVELITLGFGISMLLWAYRREGVGIVVAKIFGFIITIGAVLVLLCTSYYGITYWARGYFKPPMVPMMLMDRQMMQQQPMMMQRMQQMHQQHMMRMRQQQKTMPKEPPQSQKQ